MTKLNRYRAEMNTCNTMLNRLGGQLVFASHSEASTFRRRCHEFIRLFREVSNNSAIPYDDLELRLPKRGEPADNTLIFIIRPRIPNAEATDLDGNPIAIEDTALFPSVTRPVPIIEKADEIDLSGLIEEDDDEGADPNDLFGPAQGD